MNDLLRRLRLQRIDGRSDHEAMRDAAAAIEVLEERVFQMDALRARVSELEAAGRAVLNCNDQVCAFGHGGCPAQCRADEMLRKAIRCAGNKPASLPEGT